MLCSQSGCQVALSGRCLEGFDPPSSCPYQSDTDRVQDDTGSYEAQELINLPSGEALTERQASDVARDGLTKLVIIAGPYGSGKTTILTALFEAFQDAPFANYLFKGSKTLVGFERRCHLGREESGAESADTNHTSIREGVVFLHLNLSTRDEFATESANLLMSDISGELFKKLRDSAGAVAELQSLRRADHLCLVIDSAKIVDKESRQIARNDSRSILRSIIESESLAPECVIDIAFTKWDVVVEANGETEGSDIYKFIADTKAALASLISDRRVVFHHVAARPPAEIKLPFAHGLPTLIRSWLDHDERPHRKIEVYLPAVGSREVTRFTNAVINYSGLEDVYDIRQL